MSSPWWLIRRTRLLNVFHFFGMASGYSQMIGEERTMLRKYAAGCEKALEIGTFMGVSANIIARELKENGVLYCVDPFPDRKGMKNPGLAIAERDLKRNKLFDKVIFLKGLSTDSGIKDQIPHNLDFVFVDGDHSYEGLANDWEIVKRNLKVDGVVCLHDTVVPKAEPHRMFGSVTYFESKIITDVKFELIDQCYSMTVLRKKP